VGIGLAQLLLKDFTVHGGTIFLDPNCVVVKGSRVEEKAAIQDELFLTGLRKRMGQVACLEDYWNDAEHLPRLPVEESAELAAYREENLKPPPRSRGGPQPAPTKPASDSNATRKRKAPAKNPPAKNPPLGNTAAEKSRFFKKPKPEITASQLTKSGIFSPLTRTATIIEIGSDEEKKPSVPTRAKPQNISIPRTETEYSFEGDDFMDNPDFLREFDRVESTVLSQQYPPSVSAGPSQTRYSQRAHTNTIEIDVDKENEPERRVKRKVVTKKVVATANQSVISIEDSD
jgi:hypothetical protein